VRNEFLDVYLEAQRHQTEHDALASYQRGQPEEQCITCLTESPMDHVPRYVPHEVKRRYSWAVPNQAAFDTIAKYSPNGVVEIGAGGGYWAMLLRAHGVDVIAFDPDPVGGPDGWHDGRCWSEVLEGDHHRIKDFPDRTLLLVWPSLHGIWTHEVVEEYTGDTVIYVGENPGGCTGSARMHHLLGAGDSCYHDEGEPLCEDCGDPAPLFEVVANTGIPQWYGIHDRLTVHRRV
jgi:hypothetical protein